MAVPGSLRLLVETQEGGNEGELALDDAVASLGGRWRVERLLAGDVADDAGERLFVVSTVPGAPVAPGEAFELAYRLQDEPGIGDAEPDLPVPTYPPGLDEDRSVTEGADAATRKEPTAEETAWARDAIRCGEAWDLTPPEGGARCGAGILIGHPDTGYTRHPSLGPGLEAIDLVRDHDFLDDDHDACDPLDRSIIPLRRFPGHGTGTSSVIVGRNWKGVLGVAPEATVVPLRAVNSVVQFLDSDVARAVDHARETCCHVVSMSLGGKGFFGLSRVIDRALDAGLIVLAASGNYVRFVTEPASYRNCIAVAATGKQDVPWKHTSRGSAVDISAPGTGVWGAAWRLKPRPEVACVSEKHGTSYAAAHLAGAAALWLAFHGQAALACAYPGRLLQAAFLHVLRAAARRPSTWSAADFEAFGAGVLDVHALLDAPLPASSSLTPSLSAMQMQPPTGADRIAASFGQRAVGPQLRAQRLSDPELDRFAPELLYNLMTDPVAAADFAAAADGNSVHAARSPVEGPVWAQRIAERASPTLRSTMRP